LTIQPQKGGWRARTITTADPEDQTDDQELASEDRKSDI